MKVSNCKASTRKILLFWVGGRLLEVLAYKRWLHMEVQLYYHHHYCYYYYNYYYTMYLRNLRTWFSSSRSRVFCLTYSLCCGVQSIKMKKSINNNTSFDLTQGNKQRTNCPLLLNFYAQRCKLFTFGFSEAKELSHILVI